MPATIEFTFFGDKEISRTFDRIIDATTDLSPAFEAMADDFASIESRRFDAEGPGWAPLAPSTLKRKKGGQILVETGKLKASVTRRPFGVERIGSQDAEFGSNDPIGFYHQHGTPKMPARPVVKLTQSDRNRWVKYMQQHLFGSI